MDRPAYTVAVRVLCEFAVKSGDLDLRFTPSPTAQQGIAGHRTVAASRSPGYRSEVPLSGRYRHLEVRGRADGFDPASGTLEEVKTFRGAAERIPENHRALHRAQATVYAYLLCVAEARPSIAVSIVYFDVGRQREEPPRAETWSVDALRAVFEALCERFIAWADREAAHRVARDAAAVALPFPHPVYRRGQRELAEAVYRAARRGACLTAQAPTGIGKTVATLFPLVKALAPGRLDKIFFLTAKGTGRRVAIDALAACRDGDRLPLRVLELTARDKACEHPDRQCHGASCPLASGFYDRLPAARSAAVDAVRLDRAAVRRMARDHAVCPYFLAQELVQWSDVVVGDYNHFFDVHAMLHASTVANGWRVAVLVDEAHNLVDRGRAMYTATLASATLDAARSRVPAPARAPLDRARRAWRRLADADPAPYVVVERCPRDLAAALQETVAAIAEPLFDDPSRADAALLATYFALLQFTRALDTFGTHSLFDVTRDDAAGATTLCVRNVAPAPFLRPRFEAARTTTLFSATLAPRPFYADLLGLPDGALDVDIAAPFAADQLAVHVVRSISTRFRDRERSLAPIASVMARHYRAAPGNYLAFFSSHDYLARALAAFVRCAPDVPVWTQARTMDDADRDAFLSAFVADGRGIGFAVLGGAFAEGVDLVGTRLIGAFIATLGLPQVNPVNEELRRRTDALFGAGYDYTYLFPGLRKVSQAAGRVIRTLSDRGTVHLIDDRYGRPEVAALLPRWWRLGSDAADGADTPAACAHDVPRVAGSSPMVSGVDR